MRVFVIGAGLLGAQVVEALHVEHELTVVDLDVGRLKPLAQRFDVATAAASAVSGRELVEAGIARSDLVIACTSRDEANLVAGTFARGAAPHAKTVVRTLGAEYVEIWREGRLDVDCVVSSELETATAVSAAIGMPTARHTSTFAEGQVQIVEVEVSERAGGELVGRPLREVVTPAEARVAAVIRSSRALLPSGGTVIEPGDRVVVVGSPAGARAWCDLLSPRRGTVRDVVVYGAQQLGVAIARMLLEQGLSVRVIEPDLARAAFIAELLPRARVFQTAGVDRDFLEREGIARAQAAIFAMRDDARNVFAATIAHLHGVPYTIALAHDPGSGAVYDHVGIDITIDPQAVTVEEIVRFAHDPRTQQVEMLEGHRFEILDVTCRADGELVGLALRRMPIRGALIAAIVREGRAIFPRSDDVLRAGDRVIVFTEAARASIVERAL
jgi:trk system potassium uptake protein TrkA